MFIPLPIRPLGLQIRPLRSGFAEHIYPLSNCFFFLSFFLSFLPFCFPFFFFLSVFLFLLPFLLSSLFFYLFFSLSFFLSFYLSLFLSFFLSFDSKFVGPAVFQSGPLNLMEACPTGPLRKITKIRAGYEHFVTDSLTAGICEILIACQNVSRHGTYLIEILQS